MADVSHHECGRIRHLIQDGSSLAEAGSEVGVSVRTARRHANAACDHVDSVVKQTVTPDRECPFCGETIKRYPQHLPACDEVPANEEEVDAV